MERTWLPEAETRLTLLYCLRGLGPVTGAQLERCLLTHGLVNYFDLRLNLAALVELGQIRQREHPAGVLLVPTEAGEQALAAFSGRIPQSRRELMDGIAPSWRARCRREQERLCALEPREDGTPLLRLRIAEPEGGLPLEITLPWQGPCPLEAWLEAAPRLFGRVLSRLTAGAEADTRDGDAAPEQLRLRKGEFSLGIRLSPGPLTDRARERWPGEAEALEREIREALTEG